jgi:hypothetical protein
MSDKKIKQENQQEAVNPLTELEQLRHIIFGEAQNKLNDQIMTLRSDLEKSLSNQKQAFSDQLAKLQQITEQKFSELNNKLQSIDNTHDDNESNLQKHIDNITSEHEMFATTTQQDFKAMEQALDNESSTLANNFNEQLEQLKAYLENVSTELSSSKTDRKTLAKLLATMATNLQDESL